MPTIVSIVTFFDIFSSQVSSRIDRNKFHKTFIGAIATILMASILLFFFVSMMIELYSLRRSFVVSNQVQNFNQTQPFPFNPKEFALGIVFADQYSAPLNATFEDRYFNYTYEYCTRMAKIKNFEPYFETQCEIIQTQRCTPKDSSYYGELGFDARFSEALHCMNYSSIKEKNMELLGTYFSPAFKWVSARITRCKNSTENGNSCASNEEISAILQEGYIGFDMLVYTFDSQQVPNPYKKTARKFMAKTFDSFSTDLQIQLGISNSDLVQNFWYFFPNKKTYTSIEYFSNERVQRSQSDTVGFVTIMLYESQFSHQISYQSIFDILGAMSGAFNLLTSVLRILISPLNDFVFFINIANKLLKSGQTSSNKKKEKKDVLLEPKDRPPLSRKKLINSEPENQRKELFQSNQAVQLQPNFKIQQLKQPARHNFTIFDVFSKKWKVELKGMKSRLLEVLEIDSQLKKFVKLDLLISLLLNEQEQYLLDNICEAFFLNQKPRDFLMKNDEAKAIYTDMIYQNNSVSRNGFQTLVEGIQNEDSPKKSEVIELQIDQTEKNPQKVEVQEEQFCEGNNEQK